MSAQRLIAVDPSLTCSGWALFLAPSGELIGVGKVRSLSAENVLSVRLADIQSKIGEVLEKLQLGRGDVLVCEAPTTMRDPRAAFVVEQVRGIFETLARSRGMIVPGRINPRSVQSEVLGIRGEQLKRAEVKETAVITVFRVYRGALERLGFDACLGRLRRNQDIVDAVLLGSLALTRLSAGWKGGVAPEQLFQERAMLRRRRRRKVGMVLS
jgi:Holliday junction resolvasome RuvABC endonuclease subunit